MPRIVKVKNDSGSTDTWVGQQIADGAYYELQATEYIPWSADSKVFDDIGAGNLIVNKGAEPGDDITDTVRGWKWLAGNIEPPQSADGDWHMVAENFAHVTGNEGSNWTIEKFLDTSISYGEKMIIPNNRTFTLNFLEGGSYTVPTHIKLEWFEDIGGSVFMRRNPEMRLDEIYLSTVNGAHLATETVININNDNDELDNVETGLYYGFKDDAGAPFYRKVTAVNTTADTVTLDSGLPTGGMATGTFFGLTDRVIGQKANQVASSIINWTSPPQFFGDGINYLQLTITNEDDVESGLVTAMVNGWHTDSTTGD